MIVSTSASLTCLDVSARSLDIGRRRFASQARFVWFDGRLIPFLGGRFDLAFAACVFHHIPAVRHVPLLVEIKRVLRPGGVLVVFEHNPLNPFTVRAVNTCPFDENAVLINARRFKSKLIDASFVDIRCAYRVFFPRFLRGLRFMDKCLFSLPLGAQYCVTATKPA
jgi:SAM-dependent methyltransferase